MSNTTTQDSTIQLSLTPKREFFSMQTLEQTATMVVVAVVATAAAVATAHFTKDYLRNRDSVDTVNV